MRHYRYLVVLIVVLIPAVTMAAGLADQVSNVGGGTFDRAVSSLSGVQVVAAKGSSNASVKVSRTSSWTESFTDPNKNSGPGVATFTVWSLVASAPLNKNDDDTDVANLDGLVNASSLELTYSRFQVPGKRNPVMTPAIIAKLDAVCKRVYQAMKDQTGSSPEPSKGCESAEVVEYGSSGDQHDFESAFWDISNSNPWIWGAKAKLGYQNFEFIDATAVAKHKQSETPWAVGAFIAYNPDAWRSMFTLSAQYQDAFQNSANGTVCPAPDGSGTPLSCLNGPIGNPKETKGMQVSFEARRDFGFAATGLTATYDFEKKILGVELPVYFVKDKDGKFNAGIKGGWRDDTHDFTVSVFVSSTFGLFE